MAKRRVEGPEAYLCSLLETRNPSTTAGHGFTALAVEGNEKCGLAAESGGELREDYRGWRQEDYNRLISTENLEIRQDRSEYSVSLKLDFGETLKLIKFLKYLK